MIVLRCAPMARTPAYPPHVGTIADKIRIGHSVTVNCGNRECLHRATLDLEDMAARFGADLPVAADFHHDIRRQRAAGDP